METDSATVLFVLPRLGSAGGHHAQFANAAVDAVRKRGMRTLVAANRLAVACAEISHLAPIPVFSGAADGRRLRPLFASVARLARGIGRGASRAPTPPIATGDGAARVLPDWLYEVPLGGELRAFLAKSPRQSAGRIVLADLTARELLDAADPLSDACGSGARVVAVVRDDPRRIDCAAGYRALESTLKGGFEAVAENEAVAAACRTFLKGPIRVLPPPARAADIVAADIPPGPPWTFAYIGEARAEKGFVKLAAFLAQICQDPRIRAHARFVVHCPLNRPGGEPGVAEAIRSLMVIGSDGVEVLPERLPRDAYVGLIRRSAAILMPYDAGVYKARGSGVFDEASAAGRPVLATPGTWMAAAPPAGIPFDFDAPAPSDLFARFIDALPARLRDVAHAARGRGGRPPDLLAAALLGEAGG